MASVAPTRPIETMRRGTWLELVHAAFTSKGFFLDMTFWPVVCYCPHCQRRFAAEVGGPLPKVINWEDPRWTAFQRRREAWLVEFAHHITDTIRAWRRQVTIQHQASTYLHGWRLGVTDRLAAANDLPGRRLLRRCPTRFRGAQAVPQPEPQPAPGVS